MCVNGVLCWEMPSDAEDVLDFEELEAHIAKLMQQQWRMSPDGDGTCLENTL